jgi:dTDP-glucose pyrophosphorylase
MIPDIRKLSISPARTLHQAMQQLEEIGKKILFVTDDKGLLIGTLTDGDIRRWILSDGKINDTVLDACNKEPIVIYDIIDLDKVKEMMLNEHINCIPVVTRGKEIVDVLFWEWVFRDSPETMKKPKLDIPVVIMAGGKGTRLDPFTRILPKPLIPIGDKTILEIIIESFLDYDVKKFYLSVNHKAKIIKSYFEELTPQYSLEFIEETKPLGTAGSLVYLKGKFAGSFIVTNCDIIIRTDYYDLYTHHTKNENDITIVASLKNFNIPYGVCEIKNGGTLTNLHEKPEYNFLINTGMYVIRPQVLDYLPENTFFNFTDLINTTRENGGKVAVFPIHEKGWLDTGEWAEYKETIQKFSL